MEARWDELSSYTAAFFSSMFSTAVHPMPLAIVIRGLLYMSFRAPDSTSFNIATLAEAGDAASATRGGNYVL